MSTAEAQCPLLGTLTEISHLNISWEKPMTLLTKINLVQSIIVAKVSFFTTHIKIAGDRKPSWRHCFSDF